MTALWLCCQCSLTTQLTQHKAQGCLTISLLTKSGFTQSPNLHQQHNIWKCQQHQHDYLVYITLSDCNNSLTQYKIDKIKIN